MSDNASENYLDQLLNSMTGSNPNQKKATDLYHDFGQDMGGAKGSDAFSDEDFLREVDDTLGLSAKDEDDFLKEFEAELSEEGLSGGTSLDDFSLEYEAEKNEDLDVYPGGEAAAEATENLYS